MVAQRVAVVSRVVKSLTNLFHILCGALRTPSISPLKLLRVHSLYIDMKRTGIGINNKIRSEAYFYLTFHNLA